MDWTDNTWTHAIYCIVYQGCPDAILVCILSLRSLRCVCESLLINFSIAEPVIMKLICFRRVCFIIPIILCVSFLLLLYRGSVECIPLLLWGSSLVNMYPWQGIHATIEELDKCVCLCTPLSVLGRKSVKMLLRQLLVRGFVFHMVHVM